jgi:hypothetical protein
MAEEYGASGGQGIGVNVPSELEDGVYSNWAVVHHTQYEVTIDFCQLGTNPVTEGPPTAKVVSRVHLPLSFVMPLLQAISTNVAQQEETLRQFFEEGEGYEPGNHT